MTGLGLLYLGGTTLSRGLLGLLGVGLRFIFAKQLGRDLKQAALSRFGAVWRADSGFSHCTLSLLNPTLSSFSAHMAAAAAAAAAAPA